MKSNIWEKPELNLIGDAEDLIKSVDVDGTGDFPFVNNLASSG